MNKESLPLIGSYFKIYRSYLKNDNSVLIKVRDDEENKTSYYTIVNKDLKSIIKSSENYIRDFYYNRNANFFAYTLENYNKPMSLYYVDDHKKEPIILLTNENRDAAVKNLKIESEVINASVSGDTTRGGLNRIQWTLQDKADLIVLGLGANDMLRGIEPKEIKENLVAIHKSMALDITKKRLEMMEASTAQKANVEIKEIKNDLGEIQGTKVVLNLPIQYIK